MGTNTVSDEEWSLLLGLELRDEGMELAANAEDHDNVAWRDAAYEAIETVARSQQYFDSDDVHAVFEDEPNHPAAWGSVWQAAMRDELMEETQDQPRRRSRRPIAHASKMTRYKSLVWRGQ